MRCDIISINKNNILLEQNQKLEDQITVLQKEGDKYKAERTTLNQKIKALENEVEGLKAALDKKGDSSNGDIEELKKEVEQLNITNAVYLEKINELVEQMNKMDEDNFNSMEELQKKHAKLKKQFDELTYKAHMAGVE